MTRLRLILTGFISLGIIFCLAGTASADLNDGLLGYYSFSGNANDMSGNGNDMTVKWATLVQDRFGHADSAYYFDGVDDYMRTSSIATGLQVSDAFTISTWIYKANTSKQTMVGLYDAGGSGSPEYAMMYSDDKIRMQTRDNTGAYAFNTQRSDTVISADSWHHLVFTYDGPGYNFYLDGTLDGSGSLSTTIRDIDSSPQFYIGARGDRQPGEFYEGIIDDIRIYDRALSGSEVQELTNLVVVPEPVSTVLFLAGGAVMGFVRLRKKK